MIQTHQILVKKMIQIVMRPAKIFRHYQNHKLKRSKYLKKVKIYQVIKLAPKPKPLPVVEKPLPVPKFAPKHSNVQTNFDFDETEVSDEIEEES